MGEDLLTRVLGEIRERKQLAQSAYEESRRLERALAALDSDLSGAPDSARRDRRRARKPAQPRARAPRGANREAILAVVRDRPGVSAGEIAQATGIARSTVSPTLSRLVAAGTVERTELPSGSVGFRPGKPVAAAAGGGGGGAALAAAPVRGSE
jgi:DNA-binding transcriptional ArsR family regulator